MIRRVLETGSIEGQIEKQIGCMGDAAAVTITKILAGKKLNVNDIDRVLIIITISFADPSFVKETSDREPKTTLFVLQYLDSSTTNQEVKNRIAGRRKYVQERYAQYVRTSTEK
jgi:hypothetical protein